MVMVVLRCCHDDPLVNYTCEYIDHWTTPALRHRLRPALSDSIPLNPLSLRSLSESWPLTIHMPPSFPASTARSVVSPISSKSGSTPNRQAYPLAERQGSIFPKASARMRIRSTGMLLRLLDHWPRPRRPRPRCRRPSPRIQSSTPRLEGRPHWDTPGASDWYPPVMPPSNAGGYAGVMTAFPADSERKPCSGSCSQRYGT
ncbi:hypothetical protein C8T65DRAFT_112270 [Cerioporus squamosus]|nr:hypothetical protein C8T65DRAFT_112270 [Cerioporus squamosus]